MEKDFSNRGRKPVLTIDLDSIENNLSYLCKKAGVEPKNIIAVVKKSAYGMGSFQIASFLKEYGISHFAVASLEEALFLREKGIGDSILVLENIPEHLLQKACDAQITLSLVDSKQIPILKTILDREIYPKAHIAIDTGMRRNGLTLNWLENSANLSQLSQISPLIEGVYTHYHSAESPQQNFSIEQDILFSQALKLLKTAHIDNPKTHRCNSAGSLLFGLRGDSFIRPGVALYGCSPDSRDPDRSLMECARVSGAITSLRQIKAGESVSYNWQWSSPVDTTIATVSLGYANGLPRALSGQGQPVSINGSIYKTVGRITMDYSLVDVGSSPTVKIGDEVVFADQKLGEELSIDAMAIRAQTIGYELLCRFGLGLRREYYRKGLCVAIEERTIL